MQSILIKCEYCKHLYPVKEKIEKCENCGSSNIKEMRWILDWQSSATFSLIVLILYALGFALLIFLSYWKRHPIYAQGFTFLTIMTIILISIHISLFPQRVVEKCQEKKN